MVLAICGAARLSQYACGRDPVYCINYITIWIMQYLFAFGRSFWGCYRCDILPHTIIAAIHYMGTLCLKESTAQSLSWRVTLQYLNRVSGWGNWDSLLIRRKRLHYTRSDGYYRLCHWRNVPHRLLFWRRQTCAKSIIPIPFMNVDIGCKEHG